MPSSSSSGLPSSSSSGLCLSDVYYIPQLTLNLISIIQFCASGYVVQFSFTSCYVQDPHSKKLIGTGRREEDYICWRCSRFLPWWLRLYIDLSSFCLSPKSSNFYLWHSRLGHVSGSRLKYLVSTGALGNFNYHDILDCTPFDLIHSGVWGPAPISNKGGARYYVSFIDDYSRYCWIYLMKCRSDFFSIFQKFCALVHTQFSTVIKYGTTHQFSCTATPEQNGVAKRKHRHIVETAKSMLLSADVLNFFLGGEVVLAANHCLVVLVLFFVLLSNIKNYMLPLLCVFFLVMQKGYRCYDPSAKKLYVSRHVVFLEHIPFSSIPTGSPTLSNFELMYIDPFSSTNDDFSYSDNDMS
ncbi:hypothetical protein Prudu_019153 [Prunus dulcis]|uniref:Uncharacterized protein n=1 Tax=Prunus dulcis TaxID=3755 RepID=A0A4Y1RU48_PRUDU|nr:hypothetical protein Prudu_019153 [Prunus dulcis]